jgi:hypothetical protein
MGSGGSTAKVVQTTETPTEDSAAGKENSNEKLPPQDSAKLSRQGSDGSEDSTENFVDLPDGKHKYKYKNGDLYYGDWKDGMMHGRGTLTVALSGVLYEGKFLYNEFDGKGVYVCSNGNIYKGGFKNGYRHGNGKVDFVDGTSMKGTWNHGKKMQQQNERVSVQEKEIVGKVAWQDM